MDRWYRSCCCCGQARDSLSSHMVPFRNSRRHLFTLFSSLRRLFLLPSYLLPLSFFFFFSSFFFVLVVSRRFKSAETRRKKWRIVKCVGKQQTLLHTYTQSGNLSRSRYARAFILLNWIFRLDESNIVEYGSSRPENWKLARSRPDRFESGVRLATRNSFTKRLRSPVSCETNSNEKSTRSFEDLVWEMRMAKRGIVLRAGKRVSWMAAPSWKHSESWIFFKRTTCTFLSTNAWNSCRGNFIRREMFELVV